MDPKVSLAAASVPSGRIVRQMCRCLITNAFPAATALFVQACIPAISSSSPIDDWNRPPKHRSAEEIRPLARTLFGELSRAATGQISDSATLAGLWGGRHEPPDQADFRPTERVKGALALAFGSVPQDALDSLTLVEGFGTFASPDIGVVVSASRLADIAWLADSGVMSARNGYRKILSRAAGDFAITAIVAHELAHLALYSKGQMETESPAVNECAADVLGGFLLSAVAPRLSPSGGFDLRQSDLPELFANAIAAGHWVARDEHPDGEQRRACLGAGFDLHRDVRDGERFAGNTFLTSQRDSVIDRLVLGRTDLTDAAVLQARSILAVPGVAATAADGTTQTFLRKGLERSDSLIFRLYEELLKRVESHIPLTDLRGGRLSPGVSLFPPPFIYELLIPVDNPWRCAILPAANGRSESVACYAVGNYLEMGATNYDIRNAVMELLRRRAFRVTAIGPATARGTRIGMEQWLVEKEAGRAVISFYSERLVDSLNSSWPSRTVKWFSFQPL